MSRASTLVIGIYRSEPAAEAADAALARDGFDDRRVIHPGEDGEARARAAAAEGYLPSGLARIYGRLLVEGASVVVVRPPFGEGGAAERIVRRSEGYEAPPAAPPPRNPAPFSQAFEIPVLTSSRSHTELMSKWSFSDFLGLRLISSKAAPLSSAVGMPTLSGAAGEARSEWRTSFGMPLLSDKGAPLSTAVGAPTRTEPKRPWTTSFGMPLLSRNPAPFSGFLGLPTLTRKQ